MTEEGLNLVQWVSLISVLLMLFDVGFTFTKNFWISLSKQRISLVIQHLIVICQVIKGDFVMAAVWTLIIIFYIRIYYKTKKLVHEVEKIINEKIAEIEEEENSEES